MLENVIPEILQVIYTYYTLFQNMLLYLQKFSYIIMQLHLKICKMKISIFLMQKNQSVLHFSTTLIHGGVLYHKK